MFESLPASVAVAFGALAEGAGFVVNAKLEVVTCLRRNEVVREIVRKTQRGGYPSANVRLWPKADVLSTFARETNRLRCPLSARRTFGMFARPQGEVILRRTQNLALAFLISVCVPAFAQNEVSANELLPRIVRMENGLQLSATLVPRSTDANFSYVGDLGLILLINRPSGTRAATREDIEKLSFSDALAADTAIANLRRVCPPKFERYEGNLWAVDAPAGCQVAPYLLLQSLWGGVEQKLSKGIVAGVPLADGPIWFVSADDGLAIQGLRKLIQREQERFAVTHLSSHLYLFQAGVWRLFDGDAKK